MTDFESNSKKVASLASLLTSASRAKNPAEEQKALKDALKTVKGVCWTDLENQISLELQRCDTELDKAIREMRVSLHQASKEQGIHRQHGNPDAIDVFRIEYRGSTTSVQFGGVEVEQIDELEGAKLLAQILAVRSRMERIPFDRNKFIKQLQAAIKTARLREEFRDGYVPIDTIYRDFLFERAWSKTSFAKSGLSKNFPDYPFYQFLFDLARFMEGGAVEEGLRLQNRTPAMRERDNTYLIPKLDNPGANPDCLFKLKVEQ